jgi:hypothetical protein
MAVEAFIEGRAIRTSTLLTLDRLASNSMAGILASAPSSVTNLLKVHLPDGKDDEKCTLDVANFCSLRHGDHQFGVDPDCCTVHRNSTKPTKELPLRR